MEKPDGRVWNFDQGSLSKKAPYISFEKGVRGLFCEVVCSVKSDSMASYLWNLGELSSVQPEAPRPAGFREQWPLPSYHKRPIGVATGALR